MVIDAEAIAKALQTLVTKYRNEREHARARKWSVARTIAKAKQEAILEVLDIVAGMEAAAIVENMGKRK